MPFQRIRDIQVYYELHGPENAEVIVLSNGIFMSTASWAFQVAALKSHFRVLVYDCRGMWQSDHPSGPYSMEQHADDLAALLASLGIAKAHIAGISYGGEISMVFACKYPQQVKSLFISSAVSQIDPFLAAVGRSWMNALQSGDPGLVFDVTLPYNFSEAYIATNGPLLELTRKRYDLLDLKSAAELMAAFSKVNFTEEIKAITSPTMVLVGELDILKPRKYSEIIAGAIQGAELVIIPHAGHAVCLERPDVFNSALMGFVLKHSGAAA